MSSGLIATPEGDESCTDLRSPDVILPRMKALVILLLASTAFAAPVRVRPTVTKQGVYRQPHVRTSPDSTQRNNYSTKGNVNPYTGKAGHRTAKR